MIETKISMQQMLKTQQFMCSLQEADHSVPTHHFFFSRDEGLFIDKAGNVLVYNSLSLVEVLIVDKENRKLLNKMGGLVSTAGNVAIAPNGDVWITEKRAETKSTFTLFRVQDTHS